MSDLETDPAQVLDVLREVLLEHMDATDGLPCYRVQNVEYFERVTGRIITDSDITRGREPYGLRLTMRDGSELALILDHAAPMGKK